MGNLKYFPKDYAEAKRQFSDEIHSDFQYGRWSVPSVTETDLFVDHAYLPARQKKEKLFLIFSGVHGTESYTGHAIQMMFLDRILPKLNRDETGVLLVHALNPYGFKHHRRCTETGVNINRNCSAGEALYKIQNPGAVELSARFVPGAPIESLESHLLKSIKKDGPRILFDNISMDQFVKVACQGQYTTKDALEFGGFTPEPQIRSLTARLREVMPHYKDIVLLDLHTGLGDRARLHLLTGDPAACINPDLTAELLRPNEDKAIYDFTANDAEGFYPTYGATNDLVAELATDQQRVCALTMEYGTLGHSMEAQLQSINQWLLEHQGVLHGYATPDVEAQMHVLTLEKFYPSSIDWRESVVFIAESFMSKIFTRAGALKP